MRHHTARPVAALVATLTLAATATPAATATATPAVAGNGHSHGTTLSAGPAQRGAVDTELQTALEELVAAGATGVTALVDDGRRVRTASAGVADRETGAPMTSHHATRVGSITKSFVATVLLQLVGEGRLSLDDSVERRLPGVVPGGQDITVRQLLNHTSGIYNYTDDETWLADALATPEKHWTPLELVAVATSQEPVFAPGTSWSYSNTNYLLAGLIVERVTGHTVAGEIDRRIVRPLGLHRTFLVVDDRVPSWQAHGYLTPSAITELGLPLPEDGGYLDTTFWPPTWAWAAGAMVSTTHDLSRFYEALLGGRLLRPAQLAEMTKAVEIEEGAGYGLGLLTQETDCGTVWGHDGGIPGYLSVAATDRQGRRSTVFLLATEPDEKMAPALEEAVETATCHMFGTAVPEDGDTPKGSDTPKDDDAPGASGAGPGGLSGID